MSNDDTARLASHFAANPWPRSLNIGTTCVDVAARALQAERQSGGAVRWGSVADGAATTGGNGAGRWHVQGGA